jgi:Ca2+-binding EF-hand superfamily protein
MTLSRLLAVAACAALVSPLCFAQDKPQGTQSGAKEQKGQAAAGGSTQRAPVQLQQNQTRRQLFDQLDTNGNGSISRGEAEASPALVIIFVEVDANGDGQLSAAEFGEVPMTNADGSPAQ